MLNMIIEVVQQWPTASPWWKLQFNYFRQSLLACIEFVKCISHVKSLPVSNI